MNREIPHSKPTVGEKEARAAAIAIKSAHLAEGPEVRAFELQFAKVLRLKAAAVSSGTAGLALALRALDVGFGHEVLIPTYVCSALWHAVKRVGAEPVLVDCHPDLNPSMVDAARKRTRRTRAIILPHMFGAAADISGALSLGLKVIEDCAQSLGAHFRGRKLGTFGDAAVFSFYATKVITTGEGGMVASRNAALINRVRGWREYDGVKPDEIRENAKMTDVHAALGRVQLGRLAEFLKMRKEAAGRYDAAFQDIPIALPPKTAGRIYHRYIVRVPERATERLFQSLNKARICARRPVYRPLHWDVASRGRFPEADRAWRECVSLPIYPQLSRREQERIVGAVRRILGSSSLR